jgi:hypothetical protein
MTGSSAWKFEQAACDFADKRGEEVARAFGFKSGPVDPFVVIEGEKTLLYAAGDDFGDAFDGRLSYVGNRFLLCYNTKYDSWPHRRTHHPKVRFTIAHELGHFYLDEHRRALVLRGATHVSFTEFASSKLVEREADSFAAGLLLPRHLLGPRVNMESEPGWDLVREIAGEFDVSLTSLLVRWAQVSDFPCATVCCKGGRVAWGFVSQSFRENGFWRVNRDSPVRSADASRFASSSANSGRYAEGQGLGYAASWLDGKEARVPIREFYAAIPYTNSIMVFLAASEDDVFESSDS